MVKFYPSIEPHLAEWMQAQHVFFVASAPLAGSHVNLSPKGYTSKTFAIFDPNTVAYIDATGSGCETISHVYENGRVTMMFCSFGTSPRILRLFCRGEVVEKNDKKFEQLIARMGEGAGVSGARAVILLHVYKVQTSCGFGVPLKGAANKVPADPANNTMSPDDFQMRDTMDRWGRKITEEGNLEEWQVTYNSSSLDGLPGLRSARKRDGQWLFVGDLRAKIMRLIQQWDAILLGILITLVATWVWMGRSVDWLVL